LVRRLIAVAAAMSFVGTLSASVLVPAGDAAPSAKPALVYFTDDNKDTLVRLNVATAKPSYLPLDFTPGLMAITPNGKTAYIGDHGLNRVFPVALPAGPVGAPITVGAAGTSITGIAVSPNGATAYVTSDELSNFTLGSLTPITVATNSVGTAIPIAGANGVALTSDGTTAFVTSTANGDVYPVATATNTLGTPIGPPSLLTSSISGWIGAAPDGSAMYAMNSNMDCAHGQPAGLFSISLPAQSVNELCQALIASSNTNTFTINPNGTSIYLVNGIELLIPSDTAVAGPPCDVYCDLRGNGIVFTADGVTGYITAGSRLEPFAAATNVVGTPISLGNHFIDSGVAAPDQSPRARFTDTPAPHGSATSFDASGSSAPSSPIATYAWNFGDGTTVQTVTAPTISHTYANAGIYKATLTVTDAAGTSTAVVYTGQTVSLNGSPLATKSAKITIG
jgi:PKD repeat protein